MNFRTRSCHEVLRMSRA